MSRILLAALASLGAATLLGVILEMVQVATGGWPPEFLAGALVGGSISWKARGDEVEDLADFLGTLAAVEWRLSDGEQRDLLGGVRAAVGNLQRMANRDGTTLTMTTGDGQELLRIEPRAGV